MATQKYGKVETGHFGDGGVVEVPLKVKDNGHEYHALFVAGGFVNGFCNDMIRPLYDFAMFQVDPN